MNVVYVFESVVNDHQVKRFGIDIALARGWDVTVLDVADIAYPEIARKREHYPAVTAFTVRHVADVAAFRRELATLRAADLIVNLMMTDIITRRRARLLRVLKAAATPMLIWSGPLSPGWTKNVFWRRLAGNPARGLGMVLRKDWLDSLICRLPPRWLGAPPATWILEAGWGRPCRLRAAATRMIPAHSPDFDTFLATRQAGFVPKNQAVFLDQYLPYHPDFTASRTQSVEPERYFAILRRFFDQIERQLGLEVVIAAHPRADYAKHPGVFGAGRFGDRKVSRESTPLMVLESRLVLAHATTAVSFAVMAKKPVLVLMTHDLETVGVARHLGEELAEDLRAPLLMIDDDGLDLGGALDFDQQAYDRFTTKYVKAPGSPEVPLWQIAFDQVERDLALCRANGPIGW